MSELSLLWRLLVELGPFLRKPLSPEECHRRVREGFEDREARFLATIERGVFGVPSSPYRKLLEHAGVSAADVRASVARKGVEGTLSDLHEAGVYVTLDEFKGRRPIVRGGLTIETRSRSFDN